MLEIVENKEYFNTNGSWSSREEIPTSAALSFRVYSPWTGTGTLSEFGTFIVSYTYAFASMHKPGENAIKPDLESRQWLDWKL